MKKFITICLALLLVTSMLCSGAMARSYVGYEGGAAKFVFLPGSKYEDTDLFENFKNVLPGDVLTQKITVRNGTDGRVRIFLRAEPVDELHAEFLNRLELTVDTKTREIFDAAAGETAQLTENTLIGSFRAKGSTELTVTLTVPKDLENKFMGTMGIVPWTFIAEEIPDDETPDTGDWFEMGVWVLAAAMIIGAIVIVLIMQRKRREEY